MFVMAASTDWLVDHFPHEHCMSASDGIGWPGTAQTGTGDVVYGGACSPIPPEKLRFSLWNVGVCCAVGLYLGSHVVVWEL